MGKYETPKYDILLKENEFEIREYVDFFVVEYENSKDPEIQEGFRTLFKYISNDNVDKEKISMTVPVIQQEFRENKKMAFVVPKKFGTEIPKPNNPNVEVKKFDKGLFAVIRYSGFSNESKETRMKEKLEKWILEKNYIIESNFMLAFYNPPFVPPMFRKNEIWVRVVKNN